MDYFLDYKSLFYHLIWIDFGLYSTVSHKLRCLLWLESATNEIHIVKIWTRNSLATHHTCTITSETSLHCLNNSVDLFPQRSSIILLKTLFEIWTKWRCAIYIETWLWCFCNFNFTDGSCISLWQRIANVVTTQTTSHPCIITRTDAVPLRCWMCVHVNEHVNEHGRVPNCKWWPDVGTKSLDAKIWQMSHCCCDTSRGGTNTTNSPLWTSFSKRLPTTSLCRKEKMRRWENWRFLMFKERLFAAVIGVTCSLVAYESLRADLGRWCIQILLKTTVKLFAAPFGTFGNLLLYRQISAKRLQYSILSCIVKDNNMYTSSNDHTGTNKRPRSAITIHWRIPWPT